MNKILAAMGSLLIFTGLKAQTTTPVSKEVTPVKLKTVSTQETNIQTIKDPNVHKATNASIKLTNAIKVSPGIKTNGDKSIKIGNTLDSATIKSATIKSATIKK